MYPTEYPCKICLVNSSCTSGCEKINDLCNTCGRAMTEVGCRGPKICCFCGHTTKLTYNDHNEKRIGCTVCTATFLFPKGGGCV